MNYRPNVFALHRIDPRSLPNAPRPRAYPSFLKCRNLSAVYPSTYGHIDPVEPAASLAIVTPRVLAGETAMLPCVRDGDGSGHTQTHIAGRLDFSASAPKVSRCSGRVNGESSRGSRIVPRAPRGRLPDIVAQWGPPRFSSIVRARACARSDQKGRQHAFDEDARASSLHIALSISGLCLAFRPPLAYKVGLAVCHEPMFSGEKRVRGCRLCVATMMAFINRQ